MLEKIKSAVTENMNTITAANATFREFRKENEKNYTEKLQAQRLNEAKKTLDDTCSASRERAFATCKAVLSDIREKANAAVVQPLPDDFPATLESVKVTKDLTKTEIAAIMGKYKGNYLAYRAICDIVGGRIAGYDAVTVDDIAASLATLETMLHGVIYGDQRADVYMLHLITDSDYLNGYDDFYMSFLEGRFADAAESMKDEQKAAI